VISRLSIWHTGPSRIFSLQEGTPFWPGLL
jgi:hypothetical protein